MRFKKSLRWEKTPENAGLVCFCPNLVTPEFGQNKTKTAFIGVFLPTQRFFGPHPHGLKIFFTDDGAVHKIVMVRNIEENRSLNFPGSIGTFWVLPGGILK